MRKVLACMGLVLLAACASPRYYPATQAGEGGYYIAQTPPDVVHYDGGYCCDSFQTWGIYPWWGYAYYSPNFYPHYFSVGYPAWYGSYGWYGRSPYVFPSYARPYRPLPPAAQDEPGPDIHSLYRDVAERDRTPMAPGNRRAVEPSDPVAMPRSGSQRYGGPAASSRSPVSDRAPAVRSARPARMEPMRPATRSSSRDRPAHDP